jgi:hypothetical protein
VWHDWFNRGTVDAVVRVEVTPGERFAHMIETLFCSGWRGRDTLTRRGCPIRSNSR